MMSVIKPLSCVMMIGLLWAAAALVSAAEPLPECPGGENCHQGDGVRAADSSRHYHNTKYTEEELKIAAQDLENYFNNREAGIKLTSPPEEEMDEAEPKKQEKPSHLVNDDGQKVSMY